MLSRLVSASRSVMLRRYRKDGFEREITDSSIAIPSSPMTSQVDTVATAAGASYVQNPGKKAT